MAENFYLGPVARRAVLGLSLVAAVANLHGAQIEMADNAPGLRIGGLQRVKLIPHDPALGRRQMRKPG